MDGWMDGWMEERGVRFVMVMSMGVFFGVGFLVEWRWDGWSSGWVEAGCM